MSAASVSSDNVPDSFAALRAAECASRRSRAVSIAAVFASSMLDSQRCASPCKSRTLRSRCTRRQVEKPQNAEQLGVLLCSPQHEQSAGKVCDSTGRWKSAAATSLLCSYKARRTRLAIRVCVVIANKCKDSRTQSQNFKRRACTLRLYRRRFAPGPTPGQLLDVLHDSE